MANSMNDKNKETLSQLMDGEWESISPATSVKAICCDDELKETWSRYHLIRDVIRNEDVSLDTSLTARISQAIEDEPAYTNVSAISPEALEQSSIHSEEGTSAVGIDTNAQATQKRKTNYLGKGLSGLALAACVALATVVGLNLWQQGAPGATSMQSVASVPAVLNAPAALPGVVLPQVDYVSNNGTYWVNPDAERNAKSESRLNALLSAHIERSPTAERTGMLPYSRLVGYDSVKPEQ